MLEDPETLLTIARKAVLRDDFEIAEHFYKEALEARLSSYPSAWRQPVAIHLGPSRQLFRRIRKPGTRIIGWHLGT